MIINPKKYRIIYRTWNKLLKLLPEPYRFNLDLYVALFNQEKTYDLLTGAQTYDNVVILGQKVVDKFKRDEYVIADILAHELGHQVLGHDHQNDDDYIDTQGEHDADHLGLALCMQAGYDVFKILEGVSRFENWREKTITKQHIKSHGTACARYESLLKQVKRLYKIEE